MKNFNNLNGDSFVLAIKLKTGEEIMAYHVGGGTNELEVMTPLTLVMTMPSAGEEQGHVSFAPWMLGLDLDQTVTFTPEDILFAGPARDDAAKEYLNATGYNEKAKVA